MRRRYAKSVVIVVNLNPEAATMNNAVPGPKPPEKKRGQKRNDALTNQTYLVSDKITPVDPAQLRALKRFVGGTLPFGYEEYLRRFGTK